MKDEQAEVAAPDYGSPGAPGSAAPERHPLVLERLAMPILFIHGTDNACLLPDSTRLSYEALCAANGRERYAWKGIPGYGHVDCIIGHEAAGDVYPHILDHLRATAA